MSATLYPTQIGYMPTGVVGSVSVSSVTIGRTISGTFEGVGFGAGGRPDYLEVMQINLAQRVGATLTQKGTITMNVGDLVGIVGLPANLNLTLREITICDSGTTKKAIVLMSAPYI